MFCGVKLFMKLTVLLLMKLTLPEIKRCETADYAVADFSISHQVPVRSELVCLSVLQRFFKTNCNHFITS